MSFPAGERPSDAQLHQIEDTLCAALGMPDHQRLSALQTNTDHVHLHVALNRVHPETFRCVDPSFGQRKLMAACHQLEIALGLTRTNHGLGRADASQAPIQGSAADMEAHAGVESFARWVRDHARDDLLAARDQGWPALHRVAAEHGLELRPRGAGLVFVDIIKPERTVKASSVDRGLSMGALVKACGAFQPAAEKVPARESYQPKPLHPHAKASPLYEKYQAQRNAALEQRAKRITSWKHEQRTYRQHLSAWYREEKHKQAHGWLESLALDKGARRPLPTWQDWLRRQAAQGDRNAVEVLRSRGEGSHPQPQRQPERTGGLPPTSRPTGPTTRHYDPALSPPPYQPWLAALGGEFTYLGQRDPGSGPALVWQQGGIHYAQAATRKAVEAARDVDPGDRVMFHQGRPIIVHSRDTGHGR